MKREERYLKILDWFREHVPVAETELHYENPFQLLVSVILSAQCTDKRVNLTTPALFDRFPDARTMAKAGSEVIFPYIKSISYPNNKAKHLAGMAEILADQYKGEVPDTVEKLVKLPGVGRKTANVIVSVLHNKPAMAVDTHVFRVSARLGLTYNAKNPLQCEKQLIKFIPESLVPKAHHWLILHGRYTCLARSPKCVECELKFYCKYFEKNTKLKSKSYGKKSKKSGEEKNREEKRSEKSAKKSAKKKTASKKKVAKKKSAPKRKPAKKAKASKKKVAKKKSAPKKKAAKKPATKKAVKKARPRKPAVKKPVFSTNNGTPKSTLSNLIQNSGLGNVNVLGKSEEE